MFAIRKVSTVHPVLVDSVYANNWEARKGGITEILGYQDFVYICWNQGRTTVPWSNIRFAMEVD